MIAGERPEADDEGDVDKYLNNELILDVGSAKERWGCVTKCSRGMISGVRQSIKKFQRSRLHGRLMTGIRQMRLGQQRRLRSSDIRKLDVT